MLLFIISFAICLIAGAVNSQDKDDAIFSGEATIVILVHTYRLYYIIWKKEEILMLIQETGTYYINDLDVFIQIRNKMRNLIKFAIYYILMLFLAVAFISIVPAVSKTKTLAINIAFPFDWKNSEIVYWLAHLYIVVECFLACIVSLLSVIIWYIMQSLACQYEVLGTQLKQLGLGIKSVIIQDSSELVNQKLFVQNLIVAIKTRQSIGQYEHQCIRHKPK